MHAAPLHPHLRPALATLAAALVLAIVLALQSAGGLELGGGPDAAAPAPAPVERTPAWMADPMASGVDQLRAARP